MPSARPAGPPATGDFSTPPVVHVIPLLFALAALGDAALGTRDPGALLAALGQGLGTGVCVALALALVFRTAFHRHWVVSALIWLVIGATFSAWLIERLAALERLHSVYWKLALLVLGASSAAGLALGLLGIAAQPRPRHRQGWLVALAPKRRSVASLLLAVGAILLAYVDRKGVIATYPVATHAARWVSLLLSALALASAAPGAAPLLERWTRRAWLVGAALIVGGIAATTELNAGVLMARPFSGLALTTLRWILDTDRDGYSALLAGRDCNDLDSRINPGATEKPRNGVDDNCALGDAQARPEALPNVVPTPSRSPVSVVYISVDALNASHMGLYGYPRPTTPNVDAWARAHGVVFDNAHTTGAATVVAFSSIFRGVYARRLRWSRTAKTWGGQFVAAPKGAPPALAPGDKVNQIYNLPVDDLRPTLARWLALGGMKTFAVTAMHFAEADSGVTGPFDRLVPLAERGFSDPDDEGATRQALAWLAELDDNDRYFLWIHYLGPHTPTVRHDGVPDFGKGVVAGYDNEVATFDRRVRPLLEELERRQRMGEPLIVILGADHGEEFGNDRYHAHALSEAVTRVPLVFSVPGVAPRRVTDLVSAVDLFPTILSLCQKPVPPGLDGVDLSKLVRDGQPLGERIVLADAWVDLADELVANKVAATNGRFRVIRDLTTRTSTHEPAGGASAGGSPTAGDLAGLQRAIDEYLEQTAAEPF